ncbi:hypothetical protein L1987_59142 [Smallanthus sonchifolius]|uniref:Uncharacterized protein n=1 Tax=Smallanthus sonchifolius TaxID=185202 RepID=A0ACB9D4Z5_9ASTR|nr:hypothetical protein L1987_59142 [Smallanthus sonchifolius]
MDLVLFFIPSQRNREKDLSSSSHSCLEGVTVCCMRVGDRRTLSIPPSMSLGYKRDGENVPPNSWLVYDVEMTSIH